MTERTAFKPLPLPRTELPAVACFNTVVRRGRTQAFRLGTGDVTLSWCVRASRRPPVRLLGFDFAGHPVTVALDDAALLELHPFFEDPEVRGLAWDAVPEDLAAAFADLLAEPLAARLSARLGVAVGLRTDGEPEAELPTVLAGELAWTDREGAARRTAVRIGADPKGALAIASAVASVPPVRTGFLADTLGRIPFALGVEVGALTLEGAVWRTLEAGDLLIPEGGVAPEGRVRLTLSGPTGRLLAGEAKLEDGAATLAAEMTECVEETMENADRLEVRLTFEIDRRMVTLDELQSLAPGYVFRLTEDPARLVTVLANGLPVARGELVDAGGVPAVRLTEAVGAGASSDDATPARDGAAE